MSAFIVTKAHIDALVSIGIDDPHVHYRRPSGEIVKADASTADEIGQMLTDAIVHSVSYRYPGDSITELPGPTDAWWVMPYTLPARSTGPVRFGHQPPPPVAALNLIDCYEYQSCEPPEWESSLAHDYCATIRRSLIHQLPGYAQAPWELAS